MVATVHSSKGTRTPKVLAQNEQRLAGRKEASRERERERERERASLVLPCPFTWNPQMVFQDPETSGSMFMDGRVNSLSSCTASFLGKPFRWGSELTGVKCSTILSMTQVSSFPIYQQNVGWSPTAVVSNQRTRANTQSNMYPPAHVGEK